LLDFFQSHAYQAVSLDDLVAKSGKSRGTVLRYISQVREHCPRGWRLLREQVVDDLGIRWTWYKYCRTPDSYRRQQRLEGVA